MVKISILVGIFVPIIIYLCIAAIILFVLSCAIDNFHATIHPLTRFHQQLKLRYWPEQTFDFLGLPPEIRLMIYRYMLPEDQIYYMTARKQRFYGHFPRFELKDEIIPQPLSLLRVCRLVTQELWPLVYAECIFYITIYSIGDLLYAMDLLEKYTTSRALRNKDIFCHMIHIRIRVNDLILNTYAYHRACFRERSSTCTQTTQLWIGPGTEYLLQDSIEVARMVSICRRFNAAWLHFDAASVKEIIRFKMLRSPSQLDRATLHSMLPWYQRGPR
ncbi:hypothetical protein E4T50_01053 [Aureobasidium sp. EXF-12298]|nr:hypothetical protein E4T50_01053 [Aureobasidium sp. EXF-12298]